MKSYLSSCSHTGSMQLCFTGFLCIALRIIQSEVTLSFYIHYNTLERGSRRTAGSILLLNYEIAVADSHFRGWKWLAKGFHSQGKMYPRMLDRKNQV